jgi:hypothetical protein
MWQLRQTGAHFFSGDQRAAVETLFEAILPGGATNPGARDVGSAEYLDQLLARDDSTYYELRDWRPLYTAGLAMLNAAAITMFGGRTVGVLNPDETTSLLAGLSKGTLLGFPSATWQTGFFAVIRSQCIEGCFADQRWGGNRANVMWQWYGYPTGPAVDFDRANPGLPPNRPPRGAVPISANTAKQ